MPAPRLSEIGFSITATLETAFFIFFLTDVAQLPLAISGVIAAGSSAVDTVSALMAGVVIDKFHFKQGKYRPWLIVAPTVAMVFFILSFTRIGGDVTAGLIIGLAYIISHFCWNITYASVRSMTNVLTDDPGERAFLSGRLGDRTVVKPCSGKLEQILCARFNRNFFNSIRKR